MAKVGAVNDKLVYDIRDRSLVEKLTRDTNSLDAQFVRTGKFLENDLFDASGRNLAKAGKDAVQAAIDVGNVVFAPAEAIGGGLMLPLLRVATHAGAIAWDTVWSVPDLMRAIDPYWRKANPEQWEKYSSVVGRHFDKMKLSPEDFKHLKNGLERLAKGAAFTVIDLASMSKNAADAFVELTGAMVIGVGRKTAGVATAVGSLLAGVSEAVLRGIEWLLSQGATLAGKGAKVSGAVSDDLWETSKELLASSPKARLQTSRAEA